MKTPLDILWLFTVYKSPSDFPGEFVVRRHGSGPGGWTWKDKDLFARGPTLESVREKIPAGLHNLGRDPSDDPVIVETWI